LQEGITEYLVRHSLSRVTDLVGTVAPRRKAEPAETIA
jgi:hypothetical protein